MTKDDKKLIELNNKVLKLMEEEVGYLKSIAVIYEKKSEVAEQLRKAKLERDDLQQQISAGDMGHPSDY